MKEQLQQLAYWSALLSLGATQIFGFALLLELLIQAAAISSLGEKAPDEFCFGPPWEMLAKTLVSFGAFVVLGLSAKKLEDSE